MKHINQGDIYWLATPATEGSQTDDPRPSIPHPSIPHPYLVIQDDVINHSRVKTVVVCALTSNLRRMTEPGNVLLAPGEANLPKQSVVVVSQIETVEKTVLGDTIGSLSKERIEQILAGMRFQQASFFARYQAD